MNFMATGLTVPKCAAGQSAPSRPILAAFESLSQAAQIHRFVNDLRAWNAVRELNQHVQVKKGAGPLCVRKAPLTFDECPLNDIVRLLAMA